jgi:benzodiazapine receptor
MVTVDSRRWISLIVFVAICLAVELVSGVFTRASVRDWYVTLNKPSWTPPGWVFGPVWTVLYLLMGVAAWLIWRERGSADIRPALAAFFVQLALNLLWSILFFGMQDPRLAFWDILLLWIAIAVTVALFWTVRPMAAVLLTPYLAWVTYATVLNYTIWQMNS